MKDKDYISINQAGWNKRAEVHLESEFYDNEAFKTGRSSLNEIEIALLPDLKNKSLCHLQCHFGQDTISLSRMGANTVGVDLSNKAIQIASDLSAELKSNSRFVCCDVYDAPQHLPEPFDIVFTTYGVIGWLPDVRRWANVISSILKPGGTLIFVEFHPVVWMFDDKFEKVQYKYRNSGPLFETSSGSYTENSSDLETDFIFWNHGISDTIQSLINEGLTILDLKEYDYSPYNCFENTIEIEKGKYQIRGLEGKIPMVYSIVAKKWEKA